MFLTCSFQPSIQRILLKTSIHTASLLTNRIDIAHKKHKKGYFLLVFGPGIYRILR